MNEVFETALKKHKGKSKKDKKDATTIVVANDGVLRV